MKIKLLVIGKTDDKNLISLIEKYQNRLQRYIGFQIEVIPNIRRTNDSIQIEKYRSNDSIRRKRKRISIHSFC